MPEEPPVMIIRSKEEREFVMVSDMVKGTFTGSFLRKCLLNKNNDKNRNTHEAT